MEPHSHPAEWTEAIGWFSLAVAFATAPAILFDIFVRGYRRKMWIMNLVYPITAPYRGPIAAWFYVRHGRRKSMPVIERESEPDPEKTPRWVVLGERPAPAARAARSATSAADGSSSPGGAR